MICNIAPDDIRAQLRSDAVGITIDPPGTSRDTSTVLQAAAFPCTTEGFGARGFRDADANQGLMEETAPGMEVASIRTDDGYALEAKIPWAVTPHQPNPGDEIGLNVIIKTATSKTLAWVRISARAVSVGRPSAGVASRRFLICGRGSFYNVKTP